MIQNVKNKSKSGFSLIEVMILIVVITVALAGLMSTESHLTLAGAAQEDDILALQAVEQKIEELRSVAGTSMTNFYAKYQSSSSSSNFVVENLMVQDDDSDGMCGRIIFPELNGALDESVIIDPLNEWDITVWDLDDSKGVAGPVADPNSILIIQVRVTVEYISMQGGNKNKTITTIIYGPK